MRFLQMLRWLRWPLSLLLGSIALAAAAGFVRMQDEQRIERLRADIREMQSTLQERMTRAHLGQRMQKPFEMLRQAGFLDPATARPVWVQSLARALDEAHVMKAGFGMQSVVQIRDPHLEGLGYRLISQPVTVSMQLAHEGDLAGFLKRVLQRPVGIVKNRYCTVVSTMEAGKVSYDGPNLQARCRFDWYALKQIADAVDEDVVDDMDDPGEPL